MAGGVRPRRSSPARDDRRSSRDPHEVANVLGARRGRLWMLAASEPACPSDVYVMAPPCVPASAFESPRGRARAPPTCEVDPRAATARSGRGRGDELPGRHRRRSETCWRSVDLPEATHADGHAPGVSGHAASNAYVAAGVRSDHESDEPLSEALEKRQRRDVGAPPRGLQRPQPASTCCRWCAEHGTGRGARSAPTTASPICIVPRRATSTRCAGSRPSSRASPPEDALVLATLHAGAGSRAHGLERTRRRRPAAAAPISRC